MMNGSENTRLQLQADAENAINQQFYRALFDKLWELLCAQAQARLSVYNINQKRELARLKLEYNKPYDLSYRATIISDLIKFEEKYVPESKALPQAIAGVLAACKEGLESKILKSYAAAKIGIEIASQSNDLVEKVVASVLDVYGARQSNCDFVNSQAAAFQTTRKNWFSDTASVVDANMKNLVMITRSEQPLIENAQTNAKQGPIFSAILAEMGRVYKISAVNDLDAFMAAFKTRKVKGQTQGETSLRNRLLGRLPHLVGMKKDKSQKSEYDRVNEFLQAAKEYDAQTGSEPTDPAKQVAGENLRKKYKALSDKVSAKYNFTYKENDKFFRVTFDESSLSRLVKVPSMLTQDQKDDVSFSDRLIEKLAKLFSIEHMDIDGPLNRTRLIKYLDENKKLYVFGASGKAFGGHFVGLKYGTLGRLLDAIEALDKPDVKNRQQLVEAVKRRLTRLRLRYPGKTDVSFDEFLLRLEYPITDKETKYMVEVSKEEQDLQAYIALWDETHAENKSYDLDNLPGNIVAPTIEEVQSLVKMNAQANSLSDEQTLKWKEVLTALEPLYAVSKSLYYAVLQAYLLALVDPEQTTALEQMLTSLPSIIKNNNEQQLLSVNYAKSSDQSLSWPMITVTQGIIVGLDKLSTSLSTETAKKIFPPSPQPVSRIESFVTVVSHAINSVVSPVEKLEPKKLPETDPKKFKKDFEEIIAMISGKSGFKVLSEDDVEKILVVRTKFPGQHDFALCCALIDWFVQTSPHANEGGDANVWRSQLPRNQQDNQASPLFILSKLPELKSLKNGSDRRFVDKISELCVKAVWPAFANAIQQVRGDSSNFHLPLKSLLRLLNIKAKEFKQYNEDLVLMGALIEWMFDARELSIQQKKELEGVLSAIKSCLDGESGFPDIKLPEWKKPESMQRLCGQLSAIYVDAKVGNDVKNKRILRGEEKSDFQEYSKVLKDLINPASAVSQYNKYVEEAGQNFTNRGQAVTTAQIISQYYSYIGKLNNWPDKVVTQLDRMGDFFASASSFSMTKEKKDEFLAAINSIESDLLNPSVQKILLSAVAMIPELKPDVVQGKREVIITEPEASNISEKSTQPMTGSERLSSNARLWGYEAKDCGARNDCFFLSVADQLAKEGERYTVQELRQRAAEELKNHKDYYKPFFATATENQAAKKERGGDNVVYSSIDQWIDAVEKPGGEWGDELVAQALARTLKKTIVIVSSDVNMQPQIFKPANTKGVIVLGNVQNQHYQSLINSTDITNAAILRQGLQTKIAESPMLGPYPLPWFDVDPWVDAMRKALKYRMAVCFPVLETMNGLAQIDAQVREALKELPSPKEDRLRQKATALYCLFEVYLNNASNFNIEDSEVDTLIEQRDVLYTYLKSADMGQIPSVEFPKVSPQASKNIITLQTAFNDWNQGKANVDDDVTADWLSAPLFQPVSEASNSRENSHDSEIGSDSRLSQTRNSVDGHYSVDGHFTLCDYLSDEQPDHVFGSVRHICGDMAASELEAVLKKFHGHCRRNPDSGIRDDDGKPLSLPDGMERMVLALRKESKGIDDALRDVRKIAMEKTSYQSRFFRPLRDAKTLEAYQCINEYLNGKKIEDHEGWVEFINALEACVPKQAHAPVAA